MFKNIHLTCFGFVRKNKKLNVSGLYLLENDLISKP